MSSQSSLENMLTCSKAQNDPQEKKPRPQPEQALNCPRCDSTNTKFCYYNNYSLSQPRYFCKSCRRYWTKGGTLRNVPVGGGCRKNKRSSSSSSSSKRVQDHSFTPNSNPLITSSIPALSYDQNELTFALARHQNGHDFSVHLGNSLGNLSSINSYGFLDALRNGFLETHATSNNLQNLYYAYGSGDMGEVDNGSNRNNNNNACGINGEMNMLPHDQEVSNVTNTHHQAVTVTTMKQEICYNGGVREQGGDTKVLWGLPWQLHNNNNNGDTSIMSSEVDSGRGNWNGLMPSSWPGLLNSPLM